jgi:hypothetical protein
MSENEPAATQNNMKTPTVFSPERRRRKGHNMFTPPPKMGVLKNARPSPRVTANGPPANTIQTPLKGGRRRTKRRASKKRGTRRY